MGQRPGCGGIGDRRAVGLTELCGCAFDQVFGALAQRSTHGVVANHDEPGKVGLLRGGAIIVVHMNLLVPLLVCVVTISCLLRCY